MPNYESKLPDDVGRYHYSAVENAIWGELFDRQMGYLANRASTAWLNGVDQLGLNARQVPQVLELNERLSELTGAGLEAVPAIIPFTEFAELLANRKFPVATFLRRREDMNYIEEPDIFHEVFGHAPMLTNPDFCRFLERFGLLALSVEKSSRASLFRLFWFTVEFGMLRTSNGLRPFGAGICSSPAEARNANPAKSEMLAFDILTMLRTPYRIDILQPAYFVIDSFKGLADALDADLPMLLERAKELGDMQPRFEQAA